MCRVKVLSHQPVIVDEDILCMIRKVRSTTVSIPTTQEEMIAADGVRLRSTIASKRSAASPLSSTHRSVIGVHTASSAAHQGVRSPSTHQQVRSPATITRTSSTHASLTAHIRAQIIDIPTPPTSFTSLELQPCSLPATAPPALRGFTTQFVSQLLASIAPQATADAFQPRFNEDLPPRPFVQWRSHQHHPLSVQAEVPEETLNKAVQMTQKVNAAASAPVSSLVEKLMESVFFDLICEATDGRFNTTTRGATITRGSP